MKAVIEGLLFISGDEGLTFNQLKDILNIDINELKSLIKQLYIDYQSEERGIKLELLGNHFKLTTKQEHKDFYKKLIKDDENNKLSQAALETLSIIAYNDPISRIDIDEIRGISSGYLIRKLILKGLVEEKGKADVPGRPTLYGVTNNFLDYFGLGSIKELPQITNSEKKESTDETKNLFETKYTEK
ncbi:MAG: SMC-Scp complex subunit ScpB [Bacilli bacterium]|nr:SMC-Scp complex subunit ScpB [Bacilli bacterium]